ncbi:uncharacterized protein LOC131928352 [Physella acuta]|uniref:uncharacterized protein LOC131928352 n=1 Tax=Physella acuta TaxID=109671 RepID=UPI0027DE1B69|nr:uncharacterized protein LOC131928352 [Physella acuta]
MDTVVAVFLILCVVCYGACKALQAEVIDTEGREPCVEDCTAWCCSKMPSCHACHLLMGNPQQCRHEWSRDEHSKMADCWSRCSEGLNETGMSEWQPTDLRVTQPEYRTQSEEMVLTLEWRSPNDWQADMLTYNVTHQLSCPPRLDVVHIFGDTPELVTTGQPMYRQRFRISPPVVGCQDKIQVITLCENETIGRAGELTLEITCEIVSDFNCPQKPALEPGPAQDVQSTVFSVLGGFVLFLYWRPPTFLGSSGRVEVYHIFWGVVDLSQGDLYFFNETVGVVSMQVPGDSWSVKINTDITTLTEHETIGVEVRAAGPDQIVAGPMGNIYIPANTYSLTDVSDLPTDDANVTALETVDEEDVIDVIVYWPRSGPEVAEYRVLWWSPCSDVTNNSTLTSVSEIACRATANQTSVTQEHVTLRGLTFNTTYKVKVVPLMNVSGSVEGQEPAALNSIISGFTTSARIEPNNSASAPSDTNDVTPAVTTSPTVQKEVKDEPAIGTDLAVVLSVVSLALLLLLIVLCWRRRRRHSRKLGTLVQLADDRLYSVLTPGHGGLDPQAADDWEFPISCVKFGPVLGSGAFGQVFKGRISRALLVHRGATSGLGDQGMWSQEGDTTHATVAVKKLQDGCDVTYKQDFLREIELMKRIGYHDNIVSMLGCCTRREPICLLVEHVGHGDLLNYLKTRRHEIQKLPVSGHHYVNNGVDILNPVDLIRFAWQITKGMDFLASKGFVHRDLAARNVLVGANNVCKIGDFGLARYVYDDAVYVSRRGGKLPVKWMSIEAIFDMTFSTASDVWSFGIVLFEIVTLGGTPYPTLQARELLRELQRGFRMERPESCSEKMYQIMRKCWLADPGSRPTFTDLSEWLHQMITDNEHSFDITMVLCQDLYNTDPETVADVETRISPQLSSTSSTPYPTLDACRTQHQLSEAYPTSLSDDSGYLSPQKESVSSSETTFRTTLGSDEGRQSSSSLSSAMTMKASGFGADVINDDVFYDDVSSAAAFPKLIRFEKRSENVDVVEKVEEFRPRDEAGVLVRSKSWTIATPPTSCRSLSRQSARRWSDGNLPGISAKQITTSAHETNSSDAKRALFCDNLNTSFVEKVVPITDIPTTSIPKTSIPKTSIPKLDIPKTDIPEMIIHKTDISEMIIPKMEILEMIIPKMDISEMIIPKMDIPEPAVPETSISNTAVPKTGERVRRKAVAFPPSHSFYNQLYFSGNSRRHLPPVVRVSRKSNKISPLDVGETEKEEDLDDEVSFRDQLWGNQRSATLRSRDFRKVHGDPYQCSKLNPEVRNTRTTLLNLDAGRETQPSWREPLFESQHEEHSGSSEISFQKDADPEPSAKIPKKNQNFLRTLSPRLRRNFPKMKSRTSSLLDSSCTPWHHPYEDFKSIISQHAILSDNPQENSHDDDEATQGNELSRRKSNLMRSFSDEAGYFLSDGCLSRDQGQVDMNRRSSDPVQLQHTPSLWSPDHSPQHVHARETTDHEPDDWPGTPPHELGPHVRWQTGTASPPRKRALFPNERHPAVLYLVGNTLNSSSN